MSEDVINSTGKQLDIVDICSRAWRDKQGQRRQVLAIHGSPKGNGEPWKDSKQGSARVRVSFAPPAVGAQHVNHWTTREVPEHHCI